MIFADELPRQPDVAIAESYSQLIPSRLVAHAEPTWLKRQQYVYRRKILPIEGGRLLLRLTETPMIEVDPVTQECEVVGWGVRMPCASVQRLPSEMAHRFLDLFSKADSGRLSESEQQFWMQILDQVDFPAFCIDRAAPHYLEGTLIRHDPVCLVDWHDGERQLIGKEVARSLGSLNVGDHFGGHVKLGKDGVVRSIERIVLLAEDVRDERAIDD